MPYPTTKRAKCPLAMQWHNKFWNYPYLEWVLFLRPQDHPIKQWKECPVSELQKYCRQHRELFLWEQWCPEVACGECGFPYPPRVSLFLPASFWQRVVLPLQKYFEKMRQCLSTYRPGIKFFSY